MLIPQRPGRDLTQAEVEAVINNGVIEFDALDQLIPVGTPNAWVPEQRIQFGFKYEWVNSSDGARWHVHGHAPDPAAPSQSNASNGWVVRVKRQNRWLLQAINHPPTGQPSHWGRGRGNQANHTHVPATNAALSRGRAHSISHDPRPAAQAAVTRRNSFSL